MSGLSVLLLDTKRDNPNHYIVLAIHEALRGSGRVARVDKAHYADAVRLAQANRYDLLLAVDGEAINIDVLARLKPLVGTAVLWAWEDPYERARTAALSDLFDHVFTNDAGSVDAYPNGARYLPLAGSEALPVRESDADYDYDVSFVGSAWPNRVVFLRKLMRMAPELRFRIILMYNKYLPKAYLDLPESTYVGSISHPDFLHLINRSRVNLTLHRDFSGDGRTPRAQSPGPRLFEAGLAGGYQLVDTEDTKVDGLYLPDQEIGTFDSFEDCLAKIRAALADPERRIAAARAAQARTLAQHTYGARLETIFDVVGPSPIEREAAPVTAARARPRLLFVTHNTVAGGNFGGVEVYQETIANHLRADYEIFYYRAAQPAVRDGRREYVLTDARHKVLQTYFVPDFDIWTTLTQPESEAAFARALSDQAIDLVHFHHLINHCASLPLIARMLGVPSVHTLQDFWSVCSRFNLLDHRRLYCNIAERPKTVCDICLKSAENRVEGSQAYRRSFFSRVLGSYDKIMGNSPTATAICRAVYPELPGDRFVAMGLPLPEKAYRVLLDPPKLAETTRKPPLKVVFLGNFTRVKGAESFLEAARLLRDENIVFTICGRVDDSYVEVLKTADLPNLVVEGGFAPGALDLTRFDVSLHLSIWPETYCITLSEAWVAGVVPIVTGCGALSDRVTDGHDGYHVPIDGSGELASLLRRLEGNRSELDEIRAHVGPHLWLTPKQHCDVLTAVYEELIAAYPQPKRPAVSQAEPGAATTLALAARGLVAPNWSRPDDLPLPAMPDASPELLSPMWREVAPVRAALAEGRVETRSYLKWSIENFGPSPVPLGSWAHGDAASHAGQQARLVGWIEDERGFPQNLMFAARSLKGDLILRPIYLYDRSDSQSPGRPAIRIGFLTSSVVVEMLEDGLYGLELIRMGEDGVVEVTALPGTLVKRDGAPILLTTAFHDLVRTPLEGEPWGRLKRLSALDLEESLDDIKVVNVAPKGADPALLLRLRGWMAEADDGAAAPMALHIAGERDYHVGVDTVVRPEPAKAARSSAFKASGYEGAVWLGDLPDGTYTLKMVKQRRGGVVVHPFARLTLSGGGSKARVAPFKPTAEAEAARLRTAAQARSPGRTARVDA